MAQNGGNWLKLAKTVLYVHELVSFLNALCVRCLCSSVVVFCSCNQEVLSSIPVISKFFSAFFPFIEVYGFKPPLSLHDFFLRGI